MKKAIKILQQLKPDERYYKTKVKLLSEIINDPTVGHLCPDKLVTWCEKSGLETKHHCEDRTSWFTVSGR